MVAQTNHQITKVQWKINWHGDLFTNRENHRGKIPSSDFKVITPENPLLSKQAITSKGIPVSYTNLQLNPYSNTQLDLFYSDNLSFQCMATSMWLNNLMHGSQHATYTPTWERCWLQSFSVHHMMKITKLLNYKSLWCTNTIASWKERWTRANCLWFTICLWKTFALRCISCDGPKRNPYICLGLWEKKTQTSIHGLEWNQNWKSDFLKPR